MSSLGISIGELSVSIYSKEGIDETFSISKSDLSNLPALFSEKIQPLISRGNKFDSIRIVLNHEQYVDEVFRSNYKSIFENLLRPKGEIFLLSNQEVSLNGLVSCTPESELSELESLLILDLGFDQAKISIIRIYDRDISFQHDDLEDRLSTFHSICHDIGILENETRTFFYDLIHNGGIKEWDNYTAFFADRSNKDYFEEIASIDKLGYSGQESIPVIKLYEKIVVAIDSILHELKNYDLTKGAVFLTGTSLGLFNANMLLEKMIKSTDQKVLRWQTEHDWRQTLARGASEFQTYELWRKKYPKEIGLNIYGGEKAFLDIPQRGQLATDVIYPIHNPLYCDISSKDQTICLSVNNKEYEYSFYSEKLNQKAIKNLPHQVICLPRVNIAMTALEENFLIVIEGENETWIHLKPINN